jgi:excisionase family DNA binding protein
LIDAQQPPGRRRLLDIHQAAEYLGRNEHFVRRLVSRRELAPYKPGRALRFATADLDEYLAACRVEAWQ